jgi:hypothetical protein
MRFVSSFGKFDRKGPNQATLLTFKGMLFLRDRRRIRFAFRKKVYRLIDELQVDLDAWIRDYNEARPHQPLWRSTDPALSAKGASPSISPNIAGNQHWPAGFAGFAGFI